MPELAVALMVVALCGLMAACILSLRPRATREGCCRGDGGHGHTPPKPDPGRFFAALAPTRTLTYQAPEPPPVIVEEART